MSTATDSVLLQYSSHKDTSSRWKEDMPEHWHVRRLKDWVSINKDVLPENTDPDLEFRYMEISALNSGVLVDAPKKIRFSAAPSRARRRVKAGDTIISTVRTYLKAIWYADDPGADLVCSTGFAVLTPKQGTNSKFVSYLVQSEPFTDMVTAESVGTAYPAISENKLASFEVLIPPPDAQAAIVRYLDDVDQRIRDYVSAKERLIALLEEERQAVIHQAVTKGLNHNVNLNPSGVEWLGDVPEHWEILTLGQVAKSFRTGPFGSSLHQSDYINGGTPVINPVHMKGGVIVEDPSCSVSEAVADNLSSYRLGMHDLVFSRRGELGRCALVRARESGWLCGTGSIRVCIDRGFLEPEFLIRALQVRWVGEYLSLASVGATMANLNTGILKSVPILVPPTQEQGDLVEYMVRLNDLIDDATTRARRQIELVEEYRIRLIADVVTGKIDVRRI